MVDALAQDLPKENLSPKEKLKTPSLLFLLFSVPTFLPSEIRNAQSVSVFKRRLKTLLFRKAFYN